MKDYLKIAIEAAVFAGKEIMAVYNTSIEVIVKDDNSPLTQADQNANSVINSYLLPTQIPIISEENKVLSYSERKEWVRCWIVDPLDGTKEFIKRNGEFTVNIAMVDDGVPILGVIYVPVSKTLYFSIVADGVSYKTTVDEEHLSIDKILVEANPIETNNTTDVIRVVGSRSHLNEETQAFIDDLEKSQPVDIVSKGSSLKFCLVAEGKADVYPRYAPTMEWDTAAGHAICMGAGIDVIRLPEKTPLRYNKENLLNPWFLVSNQN